jgi:hypothetical protein
MYSTICLAREMLLVCQSTIPFALKHISYNHSILHKPQSASPREKTKTAYCKRSLMMLGLSAVNRPKSAQDLLKIEALQLH